MHGQCQAEVVQFIRSSQTIRPLPVLKKTPSTMSTHATKPRRPGRPAGSGNSAQTQAQILNAAILCFSEGGYSYTSNREIADRAQVTTGLLYHYFSSKQDLYRSALREANICLLDAYRAACEEAPEATSMEQLCLGLERVIALSESHPGLMRFAGNAVSEVQQHPELVATNEDGKDSFLVLFAALLERAQSRGELHGDVDIASAAEVLLACFIGLGLMHGVVRSESTYAQVLRSFQHLIMGHFVQASFKP